MPRQPYPLQWPDGWDRTPAESRDKARFYVGMADALDDLCHELYLLVGVHFVITSDLPTSERSGMPYANGRAEDPGIAVWCIIDGHERVFACDRWTLPAANVRAIGKTVEAIRGIARWGAADMVTRAFAGFAALPAPDKAWSHATPDGILQDIHDVGEQGKGWREVLGLTVAMAELDMMAAQGTIGNPDHPGENYRALARRLIKRGYRMAMLRNHPDHGGTDALVIETSAALRAAEAEIAKYRGRPKRAPAAST